MGKGGGGGERGTGELAAVLAERDAGAKELQNAGGGKGRQAVGVRGKLAAVEAERDAGAKELEEARAELARQAE